MATYALIHGAGDVGWYVCDRVSARLLVLVAAMVPSPGESAEEMLVNTGYKPALSRPKELAARLERYRADALASPPGSRG